MEFWGKEGMKLTVQYVNAEGNALNIEQGDICLRINDTRPRSEAHALSLFDKKGDADKKSDGGSADEGHSCVMLRPGFGRIGRVLVALLALVTVTAVMVLWELGYIDTNGDSREL